MSKGVTGQSVIQTPSHLTIKEGTATFINCTYQSSKVVYVSWYIQRSHGSALGNSVFQTKAPMAIEEGQPVFLPCRYEASGTAYLFWYEQRPNEGPQHVVSIYNKEARGFVAHHDKQETSFNLTKDSGELRDSAVYFCALRDTVRRVTGREGQKPIQWQSIETLLYKALFDGKHQFS
ncbi:UNVERIFIED_CONTAM: hypothetical protein K2H54_044850 [Gekko kuhli]